MPERAYVPRKTPSQARSRTTVEAILEAAAHVFEVHGYAAGTTNRIAERAGVSIGSLYQYFPNKDAIVVALTERHIEESSAIVAPLLLGLDASVPVDEAVREFATTMVSLHRTRPALHRVLVEEAPRPAVLRARFDELFAGATRIVAGYLRDHPDVAVADPELAAALVVRLVESIAHGLVIHPTAGADPDRLVDETVLMLTTYLSGRAARSPGASS